ncbi:MAG: hypothetical protein K5986_04790, partial [Clostridium sp.]|nr:hypothetical protein [Clostridium sp.]
YNYSENTVDWTIKVDCKDNAPINGGSIQEILGDYQSIDFSFIKFYNNEVKSENEFKSGNLEASYDNKFTYTFDGEISGVKIIKLTSKIKDNFPKGSNLKNTAKLYIDKDYINEASKEVQTNVTWIDKSGYYDSSNKTINWTINVKCNGKVIDDFKLKDIFDSKEQELVAKSIFISNNDDGSLVDNASTGDGEQFSITGKLSKDITITYKTKVSDSVLKTAKHQDLGNRAEITGTDIPKNTYADTKVGVEPELLTKTGEFIPSKGTIKWTIVVNKNELELSNATIKDIIPDGLELGKEYVEATDEVVQAIKVDDDVVQCTVNSNNELVYEFEDRTENSKRILEGKHTITYTTKIKDYAKTCIKDGDIARFTNKVTLTTDETEPILKEATIDCKPNVIKKDGKYDYKNNLVKWTITINKDKVNCLKNIVIKDAIPDGQKIVKIDDEYFDVSNSNSKYKNDKRSINYDESTKTITYQYLDEQKPMDDYDVFSYYTEITDNSFFEKHSPNYVGQTETKRVYNDAILTGEDISQVTSKGECPVDVSPIYKSAEYQDKSNVIKWTIAINRNCRDFGDVTVVDELNKALTLQTDSIKVYKISSQDELNKYNVSNADEKSKYIDDTITEDQFLIDGNKLELLLKDVKDTYILEFLTTISENLSNNGRVSNKAYIKTGDNVEETGEKTVENIRFTVGKAAGIGETGELIVNKIADNSEKTPLSGAKFELRDRFGNLVGESKVTGKDGKAVFTDLKFGVKYKITEVEPPEGYEIDTENCSKDFTIDDNADVKKLEFTFVNKSIKGSIKVVKKSADTNEFLKGAKFKVYKDDGDKKFDASKDQDFGEMTEVDSIKKPGIYEIKDLPCGDYWVKETFPPSNYSTSNYSICNEAQKVTIKDSKEVQVGNSADNIFYDSLKKGTVKLTKVDKDYPENKLTGAEFKVYEDKDADGKPDNTNSFVKLEESKTEVGVYTAKLRVGKYVLKERKAPEGFIVAEGYTKFEVTEGKDTIISNDEIHKNFINQCKKGTVKLTKVDKDYPDNKLTGAEFKVYEDKDADGQPDKDSEVVIMKESETGIYTASLRIGKYVLEESKSPEGFIEDEGYTKFEVIANQEIEIYNYELTKTFMDEEGIGNLIIKVKDKNTGSPIKGAHIDIFDENSKKICDEYTDENGEVVTEN